MKKSTRKLEMSADSKANTPPLVTVTLKSEKGEESIKVKKGTSLDEFFQGHLPRPFGNPIVAAKVNHAEKDLWTKLEEDCVVIPVDLMDFAGNKIYERSLVLLLLRAIDELYPDYSLEVSYSISRGLYCELPGKTPLQREMVAKLESHMRKLVVRNEDFLTEQVPLERAIDIFQKKNMIDKVKLLKHSKEKTVTLCRSGNTVGMLQGSIVPRMSYLKNFELVPYPPGLIMRFPYKSSPDTIPDFEEQCRLFRVFQEHKKWAAILNVKNIGELNDLIANGKIYDSIKVSEAIHEKTIARIADMIHQDIQNIRIILIAGPSSSGKTTFAKRLSIQLKVLGIDTVPISMDDYFRNRSEMPRDEKGQYDFERLDGVDVPLLNEQLNDLFDGREVLLPRYDFTTGSRTEEGRHSLKIRPGEILILEGIHALNDQLTPSIYAVQKFKIYVSALTVLNIDSHNRIPTTDLRIIRRIVRDNQYRSYSAADTIKRWASVRRGEDRYIFPFQHQSNVMFNSAMIYEMAVLKRYVEPLLKAIPPTTEEYAEAQRLLGLLSNFYEVPPDEVPPTSILREFIGSSTFKY